MFPQIFGKYVLEREIAAGGMARVYLATLRGAVGFEKRLVVKQIRPELASDEAFVRRFVDEAKTAVDLSHPNIVPVYELGVEQGIYYISMERCDGATLAELLADGVLEPELGAYLGVEVCKALDYAHRRAGIVHRDVTPRNIMIDEEGAVRLIDFGIAAPVSADTPQGEVFGSPGHMPREQIEGRALSPATDVFAVATVLYEAWTGVAPFRRATLRESAAALHTAPPPLGRGDLRLAPLEESIARCLAFEARDRLQDAEALGRRLREYIQPFDSGDLARRLGQRVRRAAAVQPSKDASGTPVLQPSASSDRASQGSHTFAIRPDMVEWTRPLSASERPEPPPAAEQVKPPRAAHRRWAWLVGSAVTLLGISILTLSTRPTAPENLRAGLARSAPSVSASIAPPAVVAVAPSATAASVVAPRAGSASAASIAARGVLKLSSDLPSSATVDAQEVATLPRSIEVKPGEHTVVFRSRDLGESVRARVRVEPGKQLRVHADFKSPNPRVLIR